MRYSAIGIFFLSLCLCSCATNSQKILAQENVEVAYNKLPSCGYVFMGGIVTDVESSQESAVESARLLAYKMGANYVSIQSVNPYPFGYASVSGKAFRC